jgi:hypothetical protein
MVGQVTENAILCLAAPSEAELLAEEAAQRSRKAKQEARLDMLKRVDARLIGSVGDTSGELFDVRDTDVPLLRRAPCR